MKSTVLFLRLGRNQPQTSVGTAALPTLELHRDAQRQVCEVFCES